MSFFAAARATTYEGERHRRFANRGCSLVRMRAKNRRSVLKQQEGKEFY